MVVIPRLARATHSKGRGLYICLMPLEVKNNGLRTLRCLRPLSHIIRTLCHWGRSTQGVYLTTILLDWNGDVVTYPGMRLIAVLPKQFEIMFEIPKEIDVYFRHNATLGEHLEDKGYPIVLLQKNANRNSKVFVAHGAHYKRMEFVAPGRPPTEKEKRCFVLDDAKDGLIKKFQPKVFLNKIKDMTILYSSPNYSSFKGKKIPSRIIRVLSKDKILIHFETPIHLTSMSPIHYGVKAKFPYDNNFWLANLDELVGAV